MTRLDKLLDRIARDPYPYACRVLVLLVALTVVLLMFAKPADARALAGVRHEGIAITLTDDKCALPAVANLPYRATWTEKGKTFEGCFQVNPLGLIVMYFDDRSVVVLPVQAFARLETM